MSSGAGADVIYPKEALSHGVYLFGQRWWLCQLPIGTLIAWCQHTLQDAVPLVPTRLSRNGLSKLSVGNLLAGRQFYPLSLPPRDLGLFGHRVTVFSLPRWKNLVRTA